jgi:hypothetical protein
MSSGFEPSDLLEHRHADEHRVKLYEFGLISPPIKRRSCQFDVGIVMLLDVGALTVVELGNSAGAARHMNSLAFWPEFAIERANHPGPGFVGAAHQCIKLARSYKTIVINEYDIFTRDMIECEIPRLIGRDVRIRADEKEAFFA